MTKKRTYTKCLLSSYGERLRVARNKRGWDMHDLSLLTGLPVKRLKMFELGRAYWFPTRTEASLIFKAVGVVPPSDTELLQLPCSRTYQPEQDEPEVGAKISRKDKPKRGFSDYGVQRPGLTKLMDPEYRERIRQRYEEMRRYA